MNSFDKYLLNVFYIKEKNIIENFIFHNPPRDGDVGPRGLPGYRGYIGLRGARGLKGEKGESGEVNIPFQIVHKHIIYPIPLNKGPVSLDQSYKEFYFGGGMTQALEEDKLLKSSEILKDPKIIRRSRIYAIYSDNSLGSGTTRTLEVEIGPCGPVKFPNGCKTFKFQLPLMGSVDYQNESREGHSNWIDDIIVNEKTNIRVKITEPKQGDVNDKSSQVLGNLYYMEFQIADFYSKITTPSNNIISI